MTFGIPDAALSNQVAEFRCAILKSVWELQDDQQLRNSPYPQVDGISEKFIRTSQSLACFTGIKMSNFNEYGV